MPRKLNKLPESMPVDHMENPASMPSANLEDTVKIDQSAITAKKHESLDKMRSLNERNDMVERARGERAADQLRAQINEANSDRTTGAELTAARKGLELRKQSDAVANEMKERQKAQKSQDKILSSAAAAGIDQNYFLTSLLERYPLPDDEAGAFAGAKNFFKRLTGAQEAGRVSNAQINNWIEQYRKAEAIIDAANNEALTQAPVAAPRPRNAPRMTSSGGGESFGLTKIGDKNVEKAIADLKAEEDAERGPGGIASALLEKYNVTIGKGRTLAKEGKLSYENQGSEELSVAEIVKSQSLLSEAYNQILTKNKKDAKALADAIAEIRNENNGSAMATEDVSVGRGVAEGRKQTSVGSGSAAMGSRGAGASSLDRGLSEQLQKFDTKKTKKEFAEEAAVEAEWESAIGKAKKNSAAVETEEADMAAREVAAKPKVEAVRAEYGERQKQIDLEAAWLKAFSQEDAKQTYLLMKPEATATELKLVNGAIISNMYRSMLTEEAVLEAKLKRSAPGANKDALKALRANLDAVRAYAANVTVELGDEDLELVQTNEEKMAEVAAAGLENMKAVAAADAEAKSKAAADRAKLVANAKNRGSIPSRAKKSGAK